MNVLAGVGQDMLLYVAQYGELAIGGFLAIEEAGVPLVIPGDLILLYGGYLVSQHKLGWLTALLSGTLGASVGSTILYTIFKYGGKRFARRYGSYILLTPERLQSLSGWFERRGKGAIFLGRFVPGARVFLSAIAGLAGMKYRVFLVQVFLASAIWVGVFMGLGYILGEKWRTVAENLMNRAYLMILFFAAIIIATIVRQRLKRRKGIVKDGKAR